MRTFILRLIVGLLVSAIILTICLSIIAFIAWQNPFDSNQIWGVIRVFMLCWTTVCMFILYNN